MNTKNLTLENLDIIEEVEFIRDYHKFLLRHCMKYDLQYDGEIAVEIIKLNEQLDTILEDPKRVLTANEIQLLIKIAEGRIFQKTTQLSMEYNRTNTHDILKIARYKMFDVFITHGY